MPGFYHPVSQPFALAGCYQQHISRSELSPSLWSHLEDVAIKNKGSHAPPAGLKAHPVPVLQDLAGEIVKIALAQAADRHRTYSTAL